MADELIDIYDENNKPLGITKMKSEAHKFGLWHRTVHIWIYNDDGEILLQHRSKNKDLYPDTWDISSAGHVGAGEDPEDAALREMSEELGIAAKKENLNFVRVRHSVHEFRNLKNSEHEYIYLMKYNFSEESLNLQEEELDNARFFNLDEFKEELEKYPERFTPHQGYYEEIIELIKKISRNK